ncbi:hypothetical protein L0152_07095 [bacterium]|nr:hypothetical protein [bacterium]
MRLLVTFALFLIPSCVWAYRPFVSTDAAVVDPKEMEIELGYFNLERAERESTFIIPQLILNYGVATNLEIVGEFEIEKPPGGDIELIAPALFLKAVIKEGILQEKEGASIAVEAGPLLPSTVQGEREFGFEAIAILSERFSSFVFHINFGGGIERDRNSFVVWGVIAELPINPNLRLVGEINGESIKGKSADNSALLGFIWQSPWPSVSFDAGTRRGISTEAADWLFTSGLTFRF